MVNEIIAEIMKDRNISQAMLAKKMGTTHQQMSALLKSDMRISTAEKILYFLGKKLCVVYNEAQNKEVIGTRIKNPNMRRATSYTKTKNPSVSNIQRRKGYEEYSQVPQDDDTWA